MDAIFHVISCLPAFEVKAVDSLAIWNDLQCFVKNLSTGSQKNNNISNEIRDYAKEVSFLMTCVSNPSIATDLR